MQAGQETSRAKARRVELIVGQLESLPTLPAVAAQLLHMTVRADTESADVVRLIESDPSLASRIITLSTRASRGLRSQGVSVGKAVVMLGFDAVRNAVLSIKVFEVLGGAYKSDGGFDRVGFWKHSVAVGCAARRLAQAMRLKVDPEEAFVCGLLHDLGKVAIDACLPKSFARVVELTENTLGDIAETERRVLGADHTVIGKRLAQRWELPETIVESIWLHHQGVEGIPEQARKRGLAAVVYLADILAREQRIGYSGNHVLAESSVDVAGQLGLSREVVERIGRELGEELADRASLLGLDAGSAAEVYYEALTSANRELGLLNARLHGQTQRLRKRSAYFELLSGLAARLNGGQAVADVCRLIAQLWREHVGGGSAAYAMCEDGSYCEGAVCPAEGEASLYVLEPGQCEDEGAVWGERFGVTQAVASHGWFFEQVGTELDMQRCRVMPLRRGEKTVGALLWESPQGHEGYGQELTEMEAFSAGAALAVLQSQRQDQQSRLSEDLAEANRRLREVQHELLQKRSMVAVGEMACGAAHEMNNPLAVIVGRAQYLLAGEQDEKRREAMEKIVRNGQEVSDILSEMLEFAKPAASKPQVWDMSEIVHKAVEAVAEPAEQVGVTIEVKLEPEIGDVWVDGGQVGVALAEVLHNAIEAYRGDEGVVEVTGRRTGAESDSARSAVMLEVTDHGCGMTEETLNKAMDPFFSLKPAGRGRGLGLSRSSRYVDVNGGRLHLESKEGQGTVVRIVLPGTPVGREHAGATVA